MPNEANKDGEVEERFVFSQEACQRLEELQQILGVSDKAAVVREGLIRLDTSVFGNETSLLPDLFRSLLPQVLDQAEPAEAEFSAPTSPAKPATAAGVCVSFKFDKQAYARIKLSFT